MSERKSASRDDVWAAVHLVLPWLGRGSSVGTVVDRIFDALPATPPASETVEAREALTKIARLLEPYDAPEPGWPQRYPPIAAQEEAYATACAALDAAPEDAHKPQDPRA